MSDQTLKWVGIFAVGLLWLASARTEAQAPIQDNQHSGPESSRENENRLKYNLHTRMLQLAWEAGDFPQARHWLESLRPRENEEDLRDFSWYYFNRLCQPPSAWEHGKDCDSVAFSSGGNFLASAGDDLVKLWNVDGSGLSEEGRYHHENARIVVFSPDGFFLASGPGHVAGKSKRSVQLYRTGPLKPFAEIEGGEEAVFSPDNRIAAAIVDMKVWLFDLQANQVIAILEGHEKSVRSVAFSPDGTRVATGSSDKTARVWDTSNGNLLSTIDGHRFYVEAVAFWKTNSQLLTVERGGPLRLWDIGVQL